MATAVRPKHYQQFNALPEQADLQTCISTQTFWFRTSGEAPYQELHLEILFERAKVYTTPTTWEFRPGVFGFWESQINSPAFPNEAPNRDLQELAAQIARNDGFDSIQGLFDWFRPLVLAQPGQPWERRLSGQIIHWTDFRY